MAQALDGENKWGTPSNMGAIINTEYDDESPVFSFDAEYMYFSSRGHRGMGGYDIFRTHYLAETKEWAKPENMGYPINTADNDLYYVQGNDIGHAYFASSRESGTGDLDLYLIRPLSDDDSLLIRGPKPDDFVTKAVSLSDEKTNLLSDTGAEARAIREGAAMFADSSQEDLASEFDKKNKKNKKAKEVKTDDDQNELAQEFAVLENAVKAKQTNPDPNAPMTSLKLRLSVVNKKTKRVVDAAIKFVDTETGEVFAVKKTKAGTFIVSVPTDKARSFTVSAEKSGFQFRNATVNVKAGEKGLRILDRLLEMEALAQNRPKILKNLYFDFDKVNLRPASRHELDLLENLMRENPKLIIEVAGHTDFVGTEEYNQKLSERRAWAVVNYLASKGIDRSRLRAKGYGKRIPVATNDDEEEGRELNRRTEFEIISGRTE
jgi:outer membrane protein OmpA-like peptidoglycan-associated protein